MTNDHKSNDQQAIKLPGIEQGPEAELQSQEPVNIADIAERIGRTARVFEYPDRTSEASRDQGHGQMSPIHDDHDEDEPYTDTSSASDKVEKARSRSNHPAARFQRAPLADVIEFPGGKRANDQISTDPSEQDGED